MLGNVFTTIISMSITASVVAVLIISFRLIFSNKLPRIFSYALWAIVLLRMLIPFSTTSTFSNMANDKVTWYRNMPSSTLLPWYVSIKGNDTTIIWDLEKTKKLDSLPVDTRLETVLEKYVENIDFDTGYSYLYWWKLNYNTVIGAPYRKEVNSAIELKLSNFEIIEVNLKDSTVKLLYKITI
jgi:hypothetical protein